MTKKTKKPKLTPEQWGAIGGKKARGAKKRRSKAHYARLAQKKKDEAKMRRAESQKATD